MPDSPALKRVFIVGCRRSGTTWTMLLLGQHPEVVALQQIDFFRRVHHFGSWFKNDDEFGSCVLSRELVPGLEGEDTKGGLSKLRLPQVLPDEFYMEGMRPLVERVYDRFAACNPHATTVVEQTPEYVQVWEEILRFFPDAYFLHVVRDPRSVFCSHRNAAKSWADPTRFSHRPADVAREWCHDVNRARAIAGATERYFELRYEDLKREGAPRLLELFEWLDLPADLEQSEKAVEDCSIEKMRKTTTAPGGFYRKGQAEGWREEMSKSELQTVEYVAVELMQDLGYELVNPVPVSRPFKLRVSESKEGVKRRFVNWARSDSGFLRRNASKALKSMPGLRKILLKGLNKPV